MKGIKLTPLLLFILLLIILVISVVFGKMSNMEGFIAFQKDKSPLDKVWIPQYSKNEHVYKLNDNMFFDSRNGNFIELDAEPFSDVASSTPSGATSTPTAANDTQMQPKDTAIIITTAGVETAVKTAVNTAAPYLKEIADKQRADMLSDNKAAAPVVPDAPVVPAAPVAPAAPVSPAAPVVPAAPVIPATPVVPAAPIAPAAPVVPATTDTSASMVTIPDNKQSQIEIAKAAIETANTAVQSIDATKEGFSGVDTAGSTITRVLITPREGTASTIYTVKPNDTEPYDTNESKNTTVSCLYKSWKYESQCLNTSKKTVLYMPWNTATYIIIIDKDSNNNNYSLYMFGSNNEVGYKSFSKDEVSGGFSQSILDDKANNIINEPLYNNQPVYKINKNIGFDIQRGNVVIIPSIPGGENVVYNRDGNKVEISATQPMEKGSVSTVSFNPWIIKVGGKMAGFYMPSKDTTVICTLSENGSINLSNVKRFTTAGVDINGEVQSIPTPTDVSNDSNYILKTQIVPPVCPTCPACPEKAICTNCGGQGGSGTLVSKDKSIVGEEPSKPDGTQPGGLIRKVVVDADGIAREVITDATGIVREVASGTAGLAKDAVTGTAGLARDAVTGTVGLAKDTVTGTVGLARDAVYGATGLIKGAVSDVAGIFRTNPTQIQNNMPSPSQGGVMNPYLQTNSGRRQQSNQVVMGPQVVDNTTYFGALPNRPSTNYMPITADFSAFSR